MTAERQPLRDVYDELVRVPLTRSTCPSCRESTLRVGTDLQEVDAVAQAVERHADKYLTRVFTDQELSSSKAGGEVWSAAPMASLAARYAVKEAVIKALRPVQTGIDWKEIEVVKEPGAGADSYCTGVLPGWPTTKACPCGLSHSLTMLVWLSLRLSHDTAADLTQRRRAWKGTRGTMTMDEIIRGVLRETARLPGDVDAIGRDQDLYRAGMTSHASVNVMLALEDAFDTEFPDALLKKSTFESVAAIALALASLGVEPSVAAPR